MRLRLAGGWGYNNLGDEAILAGYLGCFEGFGEVEVLSVDPARTAFAQLSDVPVRRELFRNSKARSSEGIFILGGGGYLNGSWRREIFLKLKRLNASRGSFPSVYHALEVRGLNIPIARRMSRNLFDGATVSVRDTASADAASLLGSGAPEIVPDAISLLRPHIHRYIGGDLGTDGKILLNLLDIGSRADRHEAEVDTSSWLQFCQSLIHALQDQAVGLIVGGGDYRFMQMFPELQLFQPRSVKELVTAIARSSGMFSVRMHPALLGTMLNVPTMAVPYCGKVRPTLRKIGLEDVIASELVHSEISDRLFKSNVDFDSAWEAASRASAAWLHNNIAATSEGRNSAPW